MDAVDVVDNRERVVLMSRWPQLPRLTSTSLTSAGQQCPPATAGGTAITHAGSSVLQSRLGRGDVCLWAVLMVEYIVDCTVDALLVP